MLYYIAWMFVNVLRKSVSSEKISVTAPFSSCPLLLKVICLKQLRTIEKQWKQKKFKSLPFQRKVLMI